MGPASHSRQGLHRQRGGSDDRKTEAIASRYPGSTETAFLFGKQREGQHPSSGSWLSRRGNATTAYSSASIYLAGGVELLGSQSWEHKYPLSFALYLEHAECAFLNGAFDLSERLVSELLKRAATIVDKAAAYRQKINLHLMQADTTAAVQTGLERLCLFAIPMPAHPPAEECHTEDDTFSTNLLDLS